VHDQAGLLSELIVARGLTNLTLVGHSLGGGVALATTLALAPVAPERIRRLVLIDSIAYRQTLPWFIRVLRTRGLGELAVALVPPERQVRMVLRYAFRDPHLITDDIVAAYAAPIRDSAGRAALVATARQLVLPDMESFTDRYREIDLPVLLLWGRQDRVVPVTLGHRLRAALPQAELQVIDACGHVPHEEHPSTALDAIERFLTVHARTP
jgi:pimeloyl-ACP methyl ester carboxylesterase